MSIVINKDGGTGEDIRWRIIKARYTFNTLRPIWSSTALSVRNKIRIFNTNGKSVLLYGSRPALKSYKRSPTDAWENEELWNKAKQTHIEVEIKKRKWGCIGHTLRKPVSNITRQALEWNPQGKGKVGRPKQTWRRSTNDEIKAASITWAELRRTSQNRVRWRIVCCGPMFHRELGGLNNKQQTKVGWPFYQTGLDCSQDPKHYFNLHTAAERHPE